MAVETKKTAKAMSASFGRAPANLHTASAVTRSMTTLMIQSGTENPKEAKTVPTRAAAPSPMSLKP